MRAILRLRELNHDKRNSSPVAEDRGRTRDGPSAFSKAAIADFEGGRLMPTSACHPEAKHFPLQRRTNVVTGFLLYAVCEARSQAFQPDYALVHRTRRRSIARARR